MYELLSANPWLFLATLTAVVIVACVGIVFGTDYPAFNTIAYLDLLEKELPLSREELIGIAGNGLPGGFRAGGIEPDSTRRTFR